MDTIRLTTSGAIVRYLIAQRTELDGNEAPLFPGVFAIFGHGNVTCLGEALEAVQDRLPTWRGHNEQSMAMAAVAFAKAKRRRQIMVATSSIGPGALNMVTAAGIAHANRLPVLLLSGDTFVNRVPDPVLQQVEPFGDPTVTVNDAFRPLTRYWDRIAHPAQLLQSLPQAVATHARPRRVRTGVPRSPAGRPGRGVRLPGSVLRASRAPDPAARPRPVGGGGGGAGAASGGAAPPHRGGRRALLPRHGTARRVRGASWRACRRDGRGQVVAPMGSPDVRRPHRGHRELVCERLGRRGRRGPRGGDPSAGFHDRLLERLRRRAAAADLPERRASRRREAPGGAARRRRAPWPGGARRGTRRVARAGRMAGARHPRVRGLERDPRRGGRRAHVEPDSPRMPRSSAVSTSSPAPRTTPWPRRAASPAS